VGRTDSAIVIEGLERSFGNIQALDGISFTVERGDTYGYLGANRAGKTTTTRILLDLIRADSGAERAPGEPTEIRVGIPDHVRPVACGRFLAIPLRMATWGSTTGITGG